MSILSQVYDDVRRLAIAGSMAASDDFRLRKLIPSLEQAAAKVPVFARLAEAAKNVVDGKEQTGAQALLELSTLVNAILYTQGETGASGTLEAIETSELGASTSQTGARLLKPLLEALTTTGSGRMELIRDAYERDAFRDLRLVRPALEALDDSYAEIADFVADKVLPLYGKAILPELRANFDLKGRAGHARRLQRMHALDPVGTRELVKQALDAGSREIKIVAIACLGAAPDDLSFLLEQAAAKAQDVRQAAYRALASVDDDAAVAVLQKALNSKDLDLAADALRASRNVKLLTSLLAVLKEELAALRKTKDKKDIGQSIARIVSLLKSLSGREDSNAEELLVKMFAQRDELAKIKGDMCAGVSSGADINTAVVQLMGKATQRSKTALVDAHATLPAHDLWSCFQTARQALPMDKVYAIFSPYLTAKVDDKKKQRDPAWAKRDAIFDGLGVHSSSFNHLKDWTALEEQSPSLDPRWLDLAVELKDVGLVSRLIRPGHGAANVFLKKTFDEILKNGKHVQECEVVVEAMIRGAHPDATDAFVAALEKFGKKSEYYGYFVTLLVQLPKSALPRLEALIPHVSDRMSDAMVGCLEELRAKPYPAACGFALA